MESGKEDDLLTKLEAVQKGTYYKTYRCQQCGQNYRTTDQGEEMTCLVCGGKAKRMEGN